MRDQAAVELRALYETVERLRAPGGCPWDRAQSHRSLRPYLLEEAYETLEAIERDDPAELREELGDLLLQVCMHCAIAAEAEDGFDIGDVAAVTRTKMVHRHPHVFAEATVSGAAEVVVNWERLKARETRAGARLSVLDGVPRSLPALAYALGLQKRPARLGFDQTPTPAAGLAAVAAALAALAARPEAGAAAAEPGADWVVDSSTPAASTENAGPPGGGHGVPSPPAQSELEEAVGELLFAAVALARRLRVNPEDALRRRAQRFGERFRHLEARARSEAVDLHDLDAAAWERRWSVAEARGPG